jgi:serine/threonine protein kinase/peroxiredoxin
LTAVSSRIAEFRTRECEVLGVNTDSLPTHERWLAAPRSQGGIGSLEFPLATDENGDVCRAYGVYVARQHLALRGVFIIDPNGVLQFQLIHNLSVGRSTDELLRVLDALQSGGLCPGDWTEGQAPIDPSQTLAPGRVIGQFRIEAILGSGAFGTVFRAWDVMLERRVALKVMRTGGTGPPGSLLMEARTAAGLNHPNVCIVYAVDTGEVAPMIVMEYIDGQSLSAVLENGALTPRQAVDIGRQIALGMAAAHAQGIVHGDLKPANILVTPTDGVKITDFGLARRIRPRFAQLSPNETTDWRPQETQGISGTPTYMAPEQARGGAVTPASDVFALGLILFEMVTGRRAIQGDNILEVLRSVDQVDPVRCAAETPEPFAAILRRALVREPLNRRSTMAEIAEELASDRTADIVDYRASRP